VAGHFAGSVRALLVLWRRLRAQPAVAAVCPNLWRDDLAQPAAGCRCCSCRCISTTAVHDGVRRPSGATSNRRGAELCFSGRLPRIRRAVDRRRRTGAPRRDRPGCRAEDITLSTCQSTGRHVLVFGILPARPQRTCRRPHRPPRRPSGLSRGNRWCWRSRRHRGARQILPHLTEASDYLRGWYGFRRGCRVASRWPGGRTRADDRHRGALSSPIDGSTGGWHPYSATPLSRSVPPPSLHGTM